MEVVAVLGWGWGGGVATVAVDKDTEKEARTSGCQKDRKGGEEMAMTGVLEMSWNSGGEEERAMSEIEMQSRRWRRGGGAESFMRVSLWKHRISSRHL